MDVNEVLNIIKKYINVSVRWDRLLQEISFSEKRRVTCISESRIASLNNQRKLNSDLITEADEHKKKKMEKEKELSYIEVALSQEHQKYSEAIQTLSNNELAALYDLVTKELNTVNERLTNLAEQRNILYQQADLCERNRQYEKANALNYEISEKYNLFLFLSDSIKFYKSIAADIKDRIIGFNSSYNKRTY